MVRGSLSLSNVLARAPALLPTFFRVFFGVVLLAGVNSGCNRKEVPPVEQSSENEVAEPAAVTLQVKNAEERTIAPTVSALGRCEALPDRQALIAPMVEGQITKLLAHQGDAVSAGQAIVQLDTTLAEADVLEKRAAEQSAVASLAALKSLPRAEEKRAAELAVENAKIAVEKTRAVVERLRPLRERAEIADSQLFEAEEAAKEARLQQESAEAQVKLLGLAPRSELIAEAESKITVAEEALKTAQARLQLLTIKAPIAGVVTNLTSRVGQTCSVGTVLGEIVDSRDVLVVVWMPVARAHQIQVGSTARIHGTAAGKSAAPTAARELLGRVQYVGHTADAQTGSVPIHILVANEGNPLTVGQTVSAELFVGERAATLCVPVDAVRDEGEGAVMTVVREGKAAVLHPQLGSSDGAWTAVLDTDLKPGEPVAISGAYNLPDGTPVKVDFAAGDPLTPTK